MNAIVTAFAEQSLVLGAILLLAIYLQAKIHSLSTDLHKEMSDMRDDLCKEMGRLSERLARVEGLLKGGAAYEAVAEQPPGEDSQFK